MIMVYTNTDYNITISSITAFVPLSNYFAKRKQKTIVF